MTRRILIIECGVVETRAALVIDDRVLRFWFGPARGDEEKEISAQIGMQFAGKVLRIDQKLQAAFVDIGAETAGFLALGQTSTGISEGAMVGVEIKRAPRGSKGASLTLLKEKPAQETPGPVAPPKDALIQAVNALGNDVDEILVDSGVAKAFLEKSYNGKAQILHRDSDLFHAFSADVALEQSLTRTVTLPSSGRLIIDETEALTAIDVDTSTMAAASSARLASRVNLEAAKALAGELSRREIGGKVVVDFLPERKQTQPVLNKALKDHLQGIQKAHWTPSGLFTFIKPRPTASLLEQFTEPSGDGPIKGRRFSLAYHSRYAFHKLERKLRNEPRATIKLRVAQKLNDYISQNPQWALRLHERYGARFEIQVDKTVEGIGFDVSE